MDITTRNADLQTIAEVLTKQRAQRHDLVVPAASVRATGGSLWVDGDQMTTLTEDGVNTITPTYAMTDVAEEGVAEKLGIPRAYLRKMRAEHPTLWAENVNGWLQHQSKSSQKLLLRTLRDESTGEGVARAVLSNGYKPIENLDVLTAALEGIRDTGAEVVIDRCDLTERRMYVTLHAPDVAVEAARLLDGYRGPWHSEALAERRIVTPTEAADIVRRGGRQDGTDAHGIYARGQEPIIFGGFELSNSDTGGGAFQLAGKLRVLRCSNGLTMNVGKLRKVHLGSRLDEGAIDWSRRTVESELTVIKNQARDAVRTFLSADWVAEQVASLEERAGVAVPAPEATVKHVTKALSYTEDRTADVLAHFIAGGQLTAGGIMQAVTSVAQTVADGDEAAAMEADGVRALELAAAHARR